MIQSKYFLVNVLVVTTGCFGSCFFSPADAIMVTTSNVQDGQGLRDEKDRPLGASQHDPDTLSYIGTTLGLAVHTGSSSLLTMLITTDLNSLIEVENSSRPDGENLIDVDSYNGRISHQPETTKNGAKTTKMLTTSSWKMSALPLVGATVAFSGGVWLKRKRAYSSGAAVKTPADE